MALFNSQPKESKEEKQARKEQEMLSKHGLQDLSDPADIESVRQIVSELLGTGLMEAGMALSLKGQAHEVLPVYYQRAIIEQNWIVIRQLDRLNKALEK